MKKRARRNHPSAFKAKVALAAIKGEKTPREPIHDRDEIDEAARHRDIGVSRPKEFHLRPLSEPDVNLSAHPAPIIHPTTDSPLTNGRMREADVAPTV